jgi:hypothetical protein
MMRCASQNEARLGSTQKFMILFFHGSHYHKNMRCKCTQALSFALCGIGAFVTAAAAVDLNVAAKTFSDSYVHFRSPAAVIEGWQGGDSAVEKADGERIVDADKWSALWARHWPGQQAPRLDFSKVMAVAIFFGQQNSGFRASLREVSYYLFDLDIVINEFIPDVVSEKSVNPYLFVVLPRCLNPIRIARSSIEAGFLIPRLEVVTTIPSIAHWGKEGVSQCATHPSR